MDVENNLTTPQNDPAASGMPSNEPRKLTDPRAMRAVAHPIRIAILEVLATEGPLTATQAGELIGESPTTCSFHLRQLAKYGFIEEVAGVAGRKRPWRLAHAGMSYSDVSDDPETRLAAAALSRVLHDFYINRLKEGLELRRDVPTEWQKATGASEFQHFVEADDPGWCFPAVGLAPIAAVEDDLFTGDPHADCNHVRAGTSSAHHPSLPART